MKIEVISMNNKYKKGFSNFPLGIYVALILAFIISGTARAEYLSTGGFPFRTVKAFGFVFLLGLISAAISTFKCYLDDKKKKGGQGIKQD